MAFILLLVLGLTTILRVETTVSNQTVEMAKAQENAKTALMVALGELQEAMRPDQRVSAWSSILDNDPNTRDVEGVNNPHLLGVRHSWNTYLVVP